jgi:hypothetical protein
MIGNPTKGGWPRRLFGKLVDFTDPDSGALKTQETAGFLSASGTLTTTGDTLALPCEGTTSATISIKGTFVGKILIYGHAVDASSSKAPRIAFLSGTGSTGTGLLVNEGVLWNKEFRAVTGGSSIVLEAVEWVSGSVEIDVTASIAPSITFINGPIHTAEEEGGRAGRAYLSGTGVIPITDTEALFTKLDNPANSGKNVFLMRRLFSGNRKNLEEVLEYRAYVNPTMTLTTTGPQINRKLGSAVSSAAIWSYQAADVSTITIGGLQASGGFVPHEGITESRDVEFIVPPGTSLGFVVTGAGNNIGNAARLSISLEWYEEEAVT